MTDRSGVTKLIPLEPTLNVVLGGIVTHELSPSQGNEEVGLRGR